MDAEAVPTVPMQVAKVNPLTQVRLSDIDTKSNLSANSLTYKRQVSVSRTSVKNTFDKLTNMDFCQGVLEKQSPSFHKFWQKRYFVLKNRMLFYYKTKADFEENKTSKGVLNF